ncbi:OmpA family protein [Motiliproteus sediminis]|uniref:OmpA family protein n=1 Tax=Motiliproteus sediminis TaxID=1468178 RepID=UPI001AEF9551|nr:OmpA family protein [Motiliproteus sediminis]
MRKLVLVSAASALLSLPLQVLAHGSCTEGDLDHCAYWHDSSGVYAKDSDGDCVRTGRWTKGTQVEGCDEIMKPMMAAPEPVDSDGDGVVDAQDQCPNTPRGVEVDAVGCPLDSDGDGVADYMDQCPGTAPGVAVDDKGCELQTMKTVSVSLNVQFANNSAEVTSAYATQMEALAYVLKADPDTRVTIHGHTDSQGAAAYNQDLSQRRADAVKQYMVDNYGVDAGQLEAVGHGESDPIADNSTREGRAKNRRVEAEVSGMVKN